MASACPVCLGSVTSRRPANDFVPTRTASPAKNRSVFSEPSRSCHPTSDRLVQANAGAQHERTTQLPNARPTGARAPLSGTIRVSEGEAARRRPRRSPDPATVRSGGCGDRRRRSCPRAVLAAGSNRPSAVTPCHGESRGLRRVRAVTSHRGRRLAGSRMRPERRSNRAPPPGHRRARSSPPSPSRVPRRVRHEARARPGPHDGQPRETRVWARVRPWVAVRAPVPRLAQRPPWALQRRPLERAPGLEAVLRSPLAAPRRRQLWHPAALNGSRRRPEFVRPLQMRPAAPPIRHSACHR